MNGKNNGDEILELNGDITEIRDRHHTKVSKTNYRLPDDLSWNMIVEANQCQFRK